MRSEPASTTLLAIQNLRFVVLAQNVESLGLCVCPRQHIGRGIIALKMNRSYGGDAAAEGRTRRELRENSYDRLANLRVLLEKRMLEIEVRGDIGSLLEAEFLRWGRRAAHNDLIFAVALASWKAGGQPISLYGPAPLPLYAEAKWGKL